MLGEMATKGTSGLPIVWSPAYPLCTFIYASIEINTLQA